MSRTEPISPVNARPHGEQPSAALYGKGIAAVVAALAAALVATQGPIDTGVLIQLGVVTVTAVGTYVVPNLDAGVGRYAKAIVGVVGAGLTATLPLLVGPLDAQAIAVVIVAALGSLGVGVVPNRENA